MNGKKGIKFVQMAADLYESKKNKGQISKIICHRSADFYIMFSCVCNCRSVHLA